MRKLFIYYVVIFTSACNSEVSVDVTYDNVSKIFEKNCETVIAYEKRSVKEKY